MLAWAGAVATPAAAQSGAPITVPPEPAGMIALFNSRDLQGWDGNPKLWSVRNGLLRGETTPEIKTKGNTFIIWQGGEPADFDLRLSFRVGPANNSGVQFRSRRVPAQPTDENRWVVAGYQAEVRNQGGQAGLLYDERGKRGRMCRVGERNIWTSEGKKTAGKVGDAAAIAATFKTDDWNEYVIIAEGNHIRHYLNGVQTIEFTDDDKTNRRAAGIIALQLHGGVPMWVEYKNIRLKQRAARP